MASRGRVESKTSEVLVRACRIAAWTHQNLGGLDTLEVNYARVIIGWFCRSQSTTLSFKRVAKLIISFTSCSDTNPDLSYSPRLRFFRN